MLKYDPFPRFNEGNQPTHSHKLLPVGVPHVVIINPSSVSLAMERALADTLLHSDQSVSRISHQLSSALEKVQAEP